MNKFGISVLAGAAILAGVSANAQAGGMYAPEGSYKDPVYSGVAVPAPMPIPETTAWYIRGDFGYATFEEVDILESNQYVLSDTNIDDTWSIGGGIGYYFTSRIRGDVTIEYFADSEVSGVNGNITAPIGGGVREFDLHSSVALANLYYDFDTRGRFSPYIGVGIGVAFNETGAGRAVGTVPANGLTGVIEGASETSLAWAVMAGASMKISEGLHIDANYRFLHMGEAHTGDIINTSGVGVDAGDPAIDALNVHQVRVGVRHDIW